MNSSASDPSSHGDSPAGSAPAPRPGPPRPTPASLARPVPGPPRPAAPAAPSAAPSPAPSAAPAVSTTTVPSTGRTDAAATASGEWGRVDEEGRVFVRTADGERQVGQWPDGDPTEVLAHFTRKYDDLVFEIDLLEQRLTSGALAPDDAAGSVKQVRATLAESQAVGDLAALSTRLDGFDGLIAQQREKRRVERAARVAAAAAQKEQIAAEAEKLAAGNDWRAGADRMRVLLDEWRAVPRLDKAADDALWRRFSTARTTYTRRRKAHFAELSEKREGARAVKEKLVKEAEALAGSTEWGPTSSAYRELMRRWKEAGPAPKGVDDALWKKFRAAQDTFFNARDESNAATDREFAANADAKEALLVEAEALLPITDLQAAKTAFRDIADRWDAAGKVPRERMKDLEARIRKVEQAIRGVEDDAWRRSNPEARARAADTVAQLETSIADLRRKLESAQAAGNDKKAAEHTAALEARESWLTEARKALEEFAG